MVKNYRVPEPLRNALLDVIRMGVYAGAPFGQIERVVRDLQICPFIAEDEEEEEDDGTDD